MPRAYWHFITVMLTTIALSAAFAHLMELPAKMTYDAALYVKLHRTLYTNFGYIAGWAEGIALFLTIGLAWKTFRSKNFETAPLKVAVFCQLAAMIMFLIFVHPANTTMGSWALDSIPPNWTSWRNQWEYGHLVRAILILVATAGHVLSLNPRTNGVSEIVVDKFA